MTKSFIKTAWDQQMSGAQTSSPAKLTEFMELLPYEKSQREKIEAEPTALPCSHWSSKHLHIAQGPTSKTWETTLKPSPSIQVAECEGFVNVRCLQAQDSSTPTKQTEKVKALCWFNDDLWCWCNRTATLYKPSRSIRLKRPQKSVSGCILVLDNQVPEQLRNRSNEAHARNIQ